MKSAYFPPAKVSTNLSLIVLNRPARVFRETFKGGLLSRSEQFPWTAEIGPLTPVYVGMNKHIRIGEQKVVQINPGDGVRTQDNIQSGSTDESRGLTRHIYAYDDLGPHVFCATGRQTLHPISVHQQQVPLSYRREYPGQRTTDTDRPSKGTVGLENSNGLHDVHSNATERDPGFLDGDIGDQRIKKFFIFFFGDKS